MVGHRSIGSHRRRRAVSTSQFTRRRRRIANRAIRRAGAVSLAATASLAGAAPAVASWSARATIGVPERALTALAVNSRGDATMAWATQSRAALSPSFKTWITLVMRN